MGKITDCVNAIPWEIHQLPMHRLVSAGANTLPGDLTKGGLAPLPRLVQIERFIYTSRMSSAPQLRCLSL